MEPASIAVVLVAVAAAAALGALAASLAQRATLAEARRRADASAAEVDAREATAREERAVQDLILDSMQEGVLLFDAGLEAAFANAAIEEHLGAAPASATQLYPIALREAVREVATSAEPRTMEVELHSRSRWLQIRLTPAGEGAVLLVVTDVTDARRVDAVRRDFVANASHELKSPAASIQAAAETLRQVIHEDPQVAARFAVQLDREALRLSRIVADLLDLSRLESGSELGERLRLDELVREEAGRHVEAARDGGIDLQVAAASPVSVSGSARDLSLLVGNLVSNAIRHTSPGGSVEVGVHADGEVVDLVVRDTGTGIPARELPRVFERFYRVDRARARGTGGTGLGLSIVRHVAENHAGSVDVESELGHGTTFTVHLPIAAGPD